MIRLSIFAEISTGFLCAFVVTMLLFSDSCLARTQTAGNQQTQTGVPDELELARIAKTPDGLHKAALLSSGRYVYTSDFHTHIRMGSIEALAHHSAIIFVGKVETSRSEINKAGTFIYTHHVMQIQTILKGNIKVGQTFDLAQSGGTVTFADGSVAIVARPVEPVLLKGHTYVIFATYFAPEQFFSPTGGGKGFSSWVLMAKV